MTWLLFKHGTLKKQYNVTIILAPPPNVLSPKGTFDMVSILRIYKAHFLKICYTFGA
jgi:hypothetical protein